MDPVDYSSLVLQSLAKGVTPGHDVTPGRFYLKPGELGGSSIHTVIATLFSVSPRVVRHGGQSDRALPIGMKLAPVGVIG